VRFEVGEGIEKAAAKDFATEVAEMAAEEAVAVVARARPLARLRSAQIAGLRRFVVRLHAGGRLLSTPQVR
jgi:hypothetical protein